MSELIFIGLLILMVAIYITITYIKELKYKLNYESMVRSSLVIKLNHTEMLIAKLLPFSMKISSSKLTPEEAIDWVISQYNIQVDTESEGEE